MNVIIILSERQFSMSPTFLVNYDKIDLPFGGYCLKIENESLLVEISPLGAEIQSIKNIKTNQELCWQGDPTYWSSRSPLLFPIIGSLMEDKYYLNDEPFEMKKHGIVRDQEFELEQVNDSTINCYWDIEESLKEFYPYQCSLKITYQLEENSLIVSYVVINHEDFDMFYSIGGHPGFNVSGLVTLKLEGQDMSRYLISGSLIDKSVDVNETNFILTKEHLRDDALVYTGVDRCHLIMKDYSVVADVSEFINVGIWSPIVNNEMAPFVCIEPWQGLPDTLTSNQILKDKKDNQILKAQEEAKFSYRLTFNYED